MKCPTCKTPMDQVSKTDIAIDVCPKCGGTFLDKSELNVLATGLAGNIEYCSIDKDAHRDRFPARFCPRCAGQEMTKINLLAFSDVIFDHCLACGGFYLDKGELKEMNAYLRELSPTGTGDEYRGHRAGCLVTAYKLPHVVEAPNFGAFGASFELTPATNVWIYAYFKNPLNLGLRIFREKWTAKLAKLLGLFGKQDIQTDNREFDRAYVVQGDRPVEIKRLLAGEVSHAMLDFVAQKSAVYTQPGTLEVFDTHVLYAEGPYSGRIEENLAQAADRLMDELARIAGLFETA